MKTNLDVVDFGFKKVGSLEKTKLVGQVFKEVANQYDLMNDVMSGGLHRIWKAKFVKSLPLKGNGIYLDVAAGTGDISRTIKKRIESFGLNSTIIPFDINYSMLSQGKSRGDDNNLEWACGNAESIPLPDNLADVYTISFGMRNVTDKEQAIREAFRILKPGGTFACLEFSKPCNMLSLPYDIYSFKLIPLLGKAIAKNEEAYRYLVESIRNFPDQKKFSQMLIDQGFTGVKFENYTGGIVALHMAQKPIQ